MTTALLILALATGDVAIVGHAGLADTYMAESASTTNYETDDRIYAEQVVSGGCTGGLQAAYCEDTTIIKLIDPVNDLPAGISEVTVNLYSETDYTTGGDLIIAQVDTDRAVGDLTATTWDDYTTSTAWTGPGCLGAGTDYNNDDHITPTAVAGPGYNTISLPVDWFVEWRDEDPAQNNNGFVIIQTTVADAVEAFSTDYATVGLRPYLVITYSAATGLIPVMMPE